MKKFMLILMCCVLFGCSQTTYNAGTAGKFSIPSVEALWIQEGRPIEFDGKLWYPQDLFDVLVDSELYFKGEYQEVPFFVEKIDVQPYNKIYTKFGRNKFRIYKPVELK